MKIGTTEILAFVLGAAICYALMFRSFLMAASYGEGQMSVVRAVCPPVVEAMVRASQPQQQPTQEAKPNAGK